MFCQIKTLAACENVDSVKRALFSDEECGENWIGECRTALSSCGSVLAFARKRSACVLTARWDGASNASRFVDAWRGRLPSDVTSLLTLLVPAGESKEASNEWVCIIVGFTSGEIGFYTEQGQLLILEKFSNSPVLRIKSHTTQHTTDTDEVYVLYDSCLCCLAISNLLQHLRYARLQAIKGRNTTTKGPFLEGQNLLTRKLGFSNQDVICDASVIGLELSNTFDHLLTAALHGGYYTGYRSVAPHNTVIMGVGARPYIGFHQALEGGNTQSLINDVAHAVASKIRSALPSWFGGGRSNNDNSSASVPIPSENMLCRYSLCDLHRKGLMSITSPDRRLLAVLDSFGRVMLVDVRRGTVVRLFKGYRNCQFGFLQVGEEVSRRKGYGRQTLFLVLYMGKHGLLEIWPLRGSRVAAFNVSQNAHLFYYNHNISQNNAHKKKSTNHMLALLYPDGTVKCISVPFHFALNSEDSDRSKDIHLMKRLRQIVKDRDCSFDVSKSEIIKATKELKNVEIKLHCLEMMVANENISPDVLNVYINCIFEDESISESTNLESKKIVIIGMNIRALLTLFSTCNKIKLQDSVDIELLKDDTSEEKSILLTESELVHLKYLINFAINIEVKKSQHAKVTFKDENRSTCSDFLTSFNLASESEYLTLKENLSEEALLFVSRQIFHLCINGSNEWNRVQRVGLKAKSIEPGVLCKLLLIYWMNLSVQEMTEIKMERFEKIMLQICYMNGVENIYISCNEISLWWQLVRDFLVDSVCPFKSMVTAQLCRAVAQHLEKNCNKQTELEEGLWENVSKDNAQWSLLIGKLDDIALLSMILSQKPENFNSLPNLPVELPDINLKYIFSKGKGSVSELTAIWLCVAGVNLSNILQMDDTPDDELKAEDYEKPSKDFEKLEIITFFDKLHLLKNQFPHSLSANNLIANMCWEYMKFWSSNHEELIFLEAALKCLKSISFVTLRCGICSMVWSTYLVFFYENVCKLISKVGKLPRETLTRQNVGLTDVQLLKFLEIINDFLDMFLCSVMSKEEYVSGSKKLENTWEGSQYTLTELALLKSNVNIDVLQVHYQLSAAIYYQCFLGSNFWKHSSNLFDVESQKCLFSPLSNSSDSTLHNQLNDSRMMVHRTTFLSRLVHKCIDLSKDKDAWIERIQDLARFWRVNNDYIRREWVSKLYAVGLDSEAESSLVLVTDCKALLDVLIPIAGRRLKHFVDYCQNKAEILAILTPQVTSYLDKLVEESNEPSYITSLDTTCRFIELVMTHCESRKYSVAYKNASMLLDACISIQDHNK